MWTGAAIIPGYALPSAGQGLDVITMLFVGPPGSGKSMLAQRLPGLLPPLTPQELLETSMVWSVAGMIERGAITRDRPFRSPHHSASMAALTGGGLRARPGEVSLAHNGVLFLDELPEFSPQALDSLRQPLETGEVTVARANAHVRYPARFQLVAAMNPCDRVALLLPPGTARAAGRTRRSDASSGRQHWPAARHTPPPAGASLDRRGGHRGCRSQDMDVVGTGRARAHRLPVPGHHSLPRLRAVAGAGDPRRPAPHRAATAWAFHR